MGFAALDELYGIIVERLESRPRGSYTWMIASRGRSYVARKVGEEAVELVVEAVSGRREGVLGEAVDLLYHLLVLLAMMGVTPEDVEREIRGRMK